MYIDKVGHTIDLVANATQLPNWQFGLSEVLQNRAGFCLLSTPVEEIGNRQAFYIIKQLVQFAPPTTYDSTSLYSYNRLSAQHTYVMSELAYAARPDYHHCDIEMAELGPAQVPNNNLALFYALADNHTFHPDVYRHVAFFTAASLVTELGK